MNTCVRVDKHLFSRGHSVPKRDLQDLRQVEHERCNLLGCITNYRSITKTV